jgi:hypothetical protein
MNNHYNIYCAVGWECGSYSWKYEEEKCEKCFYITNNFVKNTYNSLKSFHPHIINEMIKVMKNYE